MRKINIEKSLLYQLYVEEGKSSLAIADELGVSRQTVVNKLKEFNIQIREFRFKKDLIQKVEPLYRNKEIFNKVYCELKSLTKLATHFNISVTTAFEWRKLHDVPTIKSCSDEAIFKKRSNRPWSNKETLELEYTKYSLIDLASKWGCHPTTISDWMKYFNIPKRNSEEQWKLKSKRGNRIIAKDSINLESYLRFYLNNPVRLSSKIIPIIKKLISKCQICGYSEVLDLHHLNFIDSDNRPENHIVVCPNCHAKIHRLGLKIDSENLISWDVLLKMKKLTQTQNKEELREAGKRSNI